MAVESYDQIMARLNNPYGFASVQPKTPASDFTNYVQTLLSEPNPQGGMFRMQDIVDERKRKAKEEEEAKARALAGGLGMFNQVSGGSESGGGVTLTPEQIAFLENETLDQRGERLKQDWLGLKPIALALAAPGLFAKEYGGDFFNSQDNFLSRLFGETQPTISRNPYETMRSDISESTPTITPGGVAYVVDGSGNIVTSSDGSAIGTGSSDQARSEAQAAANDMFSSVGGDFYI